MLDDIYRIRDDRVKTVEWHGDALLYDLQLYELGEGQEEFWCWNPEVENQDLRHYIKEIPYSRKCIVWTYNGEWIVKLFKDGWYPYHGYETFEIKRPTFVWAKNPDVDKLVTYDNDPYATFEPSPFDSQYKLVWYLDKRVNPLDYDVWAMSCTPTGVEVLGTKFMGYLMPEIDIEYSEYIPDIGIDLDECYPAFWDLAFECAWELDPIHQTDRRLWVVKYSPAFRKPKGWKWYGTISPMHYIEPNPDLPEELTYDLDYVIPWHDLAYEHVWMLDNAHLKNGEEEIWAFKIRVTNDIVGTSIIDYISPNVHVTFNEDLPQVDYDIDYPIPWHDLAYEHVWMLDNQRLKHGEEEIWAVKLCAVKNPEGTKFIDFVDPVPKLEFNPDLEGYKFDTGYIAPWYDLAYEHVWMIDPDCYTGHDEVWAFRKKYVDEVVGTKVLGTITPDQTLIFNTALKDLYIEIDYKIPSHDRFYEHVWYTNINGERVWAAKLLATDSPTGLKEMGEVVPMIPKQLDVIFISYHQPNAEENWLRVLEKAPHAKRVDGVDGILEAHKAAANLAETDMFYAVDGDAWLADDWTFDFQPSLYDRDCVYVWNSENPVNGLTYGYGGVKLFPTSLVKKTHKWGTDLTISVGKKMKVIDKISNITKFNTSEFDTWRSAFRECAKLALKDDAESKDRLAKWLTVNYGDDYSDWAKKGATEGRDYALNNPSISRVNDYNWLRQKFEETDE